MIHPTNQIAIIGAGFSGLAAARILHQKGISFRLFEARERLGGRVYTKQIQEDLYLDLGGQWIGPSQTRMYELCKEYGVPYFETYNQGQSILDLNGRIKSYKGTIPKLDIISLLNLDMIVRKLERMASKIDLEKPWTHPKAQEFDGQTLMDFLKRNSKTEACLQVMKVGMQTIFSCEPEELSLLHALFYIKSGTSLDVLISIKNGAQQHRIHGGMQTLAEAIAKPFFDRIQFDSPVLSIIQEKEKITLSTSKGAQVFSHIIFAVPPPLLKKIGINPPLSDQKQKLLEGYEMGYIGKCQMVFAKPFWRHKNLSGQAVSDSEFYLQTIFDSSPADSKYGVLMGFVIGNKARKFFQMDEDSRKQAVKKQLIQYFGEEANQEINYVDHTMNEETWSEGCYAGIREVNSWTKYQNSYSQSEGRLHFAGTEAATRWHGYIEGAVRAGETAAEKILQELNND
ncbi:MAG TPA: amine oxidase [Algoriphagus sp.]|jgi:monoamine oxidase|uniref:flavin monoamine oxidase family protein n=3 Tax=Algoriphagus TaxID=246875 RepID=UPI000C5E9FE2|nr:MULTISPECIES: flavin monoamine oxidase family protein [unclassified Algoriphagus]MAL13988.1 amine oxidase [Algoriphagus sp.]MAN87816.1 amine oxidase [Algoriphagus sp.]HAH36159.1 amine oxidase [Algoriphagus sp.]HCB47798.1 amine oxidase [Algoriphagus sp.]HCD86553.1 amine oxidase [Algoriphagus sp.]|tara:strand:+ start:859 stop:2223 length:1365 start_codon:yes stop_codon:yes gene_type:complete